MSQIIDGVAEATGVALVAGDGFEAWTGGIWIKLLPFPLRVVPGGQP